MGLLNAGTSQGSEGSEGSNNHPAPLEPSLNQSMIRRKASVSVAMKLGHMWY